MTDQPVIRDWHCSNCGLEYRSFDVPAKRAWHQCPRMNGALTPMVEDGRDAIHRILLREDYVGPSAVCSVRDSNNRVISSISTEFADGSNQLTVYMPCVIVNTKTEGIH